jgi:hypothetical protein
MGSIMDDKPKTTIFGFPVVESDAVPEKTIIFGRLPTAEEIREHGSYEAAVKAQAEAGEWSKITGVATE